MRRRTGHPALDVHALVTVVPVHERARVQWDVGKALRAQVVFVDADQLGDIGILLVKDQRQQIVFRFRSAFARLVGEQADFEQDLQDVGARSGAGRRQAQESLVRRPLPVARRSPALGLLACAKP